MKSFFKPIILSAALLGGMTSCDDFLTVEPVDKLVADNYYTSRDMVRSETLSLYSAYTWSNFFMNFNWKLDELVGDLYYTYDQEGQWYFGNYNAGNQYILEGWKGLYNVILQANSVINDMPGPASNNGVAQEDINAAVAEARCIRAFCYYQIAEIWHDAPIVTDNSSNISSNNLSSPRHTQKSIYQFAMEDLNYAVENLPENDADACRATKYTALALRAKLGVTMAAHTDYDYDRNALYAQAAADAKEVIDAKTPIQNIDFSTLFDVDSNNGEESLLAIQCMVYGYSYGNNRNVSWARSAVIADQQWGGGKGPTIALQSLYDQSDKRRKWTYMTLNDYYANLDKADGGYTYLYINRDSEGTIVEDRNEMNAHIKKYVIGKSADCDGQVGTSQDAGNNLYLLRLADVYLLYAEALMGTADQTSDTNALGAVNAVRERAGLAGYAAPLTYEKLLEERHREFAFECQNWFDVLRLSYRKGQDYALSYLNTGFNTGYNRAAMYVQKAGGVDQSQENLKDSYVIATSKNEGASYDPILLSTSSFIVPIPQKAQTSTPQLTEDPVDYYAE